MSDTALLDEIGSQIEKIKSAGLYKSERVITSPQEPHVGVRDRQQVLNLCANNYLGLADHPAIVKAAHDALDRWGYGMASEQNIDEAQIDRVVEELRYPPARETR